MPGIKRTSLTAALKAQGNSASAARVDATSRGALVAVVRRWGGAFWVFQGLGCFNQPTIETLTVFFFNVGMQMSLQ